MPRGIKKTVEAPAEEPIEQGLEVADDAKIEISSQGNMGCKAVEVLCANGEVYRTYSEKKHGKGFFQLAEGFVNRYNQPHPTIPSKYKEDLSPIVDGYEIEKIKNGEITRAQYDRFEAMGITGSGGREGEVTHPAARPLTLRPVK